MVGAQVFFVVGRSNFIEDVEKLPCWNNTWVGEGFKLREAA